MNKTPLEMVREFASTMGQPLDQHYLSSKDYEKFPMEDIIKLHALESLRLDLIDEEVDEIHKAIGPEELLKELADLVYVTYGYAASFGWDLDEALRRVHKNNMERCIWPDGSVKRREDGKVLKNPDAPKINLKDLV